MNKQEKIIVAVLFAAVLGWSFFNRNNLTPKVPVESDQAQAVASQMAVDRAQSNVAASDIPTEPASPIHVPAASIQERVTKHEKEEMLASVSDELLTLEVTSWGGGISSAELQDYAEISNTNTGLVVLDFKNDPALTLTGIAGLGPDDDFEVAFNQSAGEITVRRTTAEQLSFKRVIKLEGSYRISIVDEFSNLSSSTMSLGRHYVDMGPMRRVNSSTSGESSVAYLDVNSLGAGGTGNVIFWDVKPPKGELKLSKRFGGAAGGGCSMFGPALTAQLPVEISPVNWSLPTDWVALKNKFFLQSLMPKSEASGFVMRAKRVVPETENPSIPKSWSKTAMLDEISASLAFEGIDLEPGKSMVREMEYYIGPQKHDLLKQMGNYQDRIMFRTWPYFGWFRTVCVWMLLVMNAIYSVVPNYGVAIILLTVLIKILFWPIMQKSTDSMKKMQDLKPQLDILKEKYKSNPQKMQQEQMALYKKHGVNPMASCLPMLIQMPVFIAMFTVIRKAVELRGAGFLWISDLSEPEMLFSDVLPMPLNILPLLMAATMFLQQKMTPSTGDAQQKQMMMMMPVMMLIFLYNMASGLTLYWTVSQLLSILQLYFQNRKK